MRDGRKRRPFYALAGSIFLAAFAAGCEDEPPISRLNLAAVFEPDQLDFGDVTVGTRDNREVVLKNTSAIAFVIQEVETPEGFILQGEKETLAGEAIAGGGELPLTVVFVAQNEGERSGEIKVRASDSEAILKVRAAGVVRRLPVLLLEPPSVDFGTLEVGREARVNITVRNTGNAPGTITEATLESLGGPVTAMSQYGIGTPLPLTVPEGGNQALTIIYRSQFEGLRPDRMLFAAAPQSPLVLDLRGTGQAARGGLFCDPSRVDFGPVERGQTRNLTVRCTARGGGVRFINATLPQNADDFALPSPPGTADLSDGQSVDIQLEFRPQALPGVVTTNLTVQSNGAMGLQTTQIPVSGEIVPPPVTETAISVVLRWDTDLTDMDMHFVRPGGSLFALDGSDCFYRFMSPDWGTPGQTLDNPFLDVDDTDGEGPESLNLSQSGPADYQIYVHSFSDSNRRNATRATVEVYLSGMRVATLTQALSCHDMWHVGTVRWNGTSGTFVQNGNVGFASQGYCF